MLKLGKINGLNIYFEEIFNDMEKTFKHSPKEIYDDLLRKNALMELLNAIRFTYFLLRKKKRA